MEKELKIQVPEGYEIDRENSTLECIKFKPININPTYEDICDNVFDDKVWYIDEEGIIDYLRKDDIYKTDLYYQNNSPSEKQLQKVMALNQLFTIARYYNERWEPDYNNACSWKFAIEYNKGQYRINSYNLTNTGGPVFKSREDAQAVIDNPNLRSILDTIFK